MPSNDWRPETDLWTVTRPLGSTREQHLIDFIKLLVIGLLILYNRNLGWGLMEQDANQQAGRRGARLGISTQIHQKRVFD